MFIFFNFSNCALFWKSFSTFPSIQCWHGRGRFVLGSIGIFWMFNRLCRLWKITLEHWSNWWHPGLPDVYYNRWINRLINIGRKAAKKRGIYEQKYVVSRKICIELSSFPVFSRYSIDMWNLKFWRYLDNEEIYRWKLECFWNRKNEKGNDFKNCVEVEYFTIAS